MIDFSLHLVQCVWFVLDYHCFCWSLDFVIVALLVESDAVCAVKADD